ncbi:hypothetical protein [uncultured Roseibium sp.]|uniref:PDC sensor domain-containing protein n=1 Tax=uncultured Roseibium sp. TaxID=1936171 RepID=UPI0026075118|nr:hypothetical protein [uncultured Roseibium sp.]
MARALFVSLLFLFVFAAKASSQPATTDEVLRDVRTSITLNQLSAERILIGIDHGLDAAGYALKFIENSRVIHEEFREIAERLPGVRAIIAVGPDGRLEIDSYQFPAPDVNLGDREYVKQSRLGRGLYMGAAKIGRTSGIPFLPVSKLVGDHVIAAIISPHFLIHEEGRCADCVSAILREDGTLLASFPPAAQIPPNILSMPMVNRNIEGNSASLFSKTSSVIGWRRSEMFPFIALSARGVRSSAPIGIDDR